MAAFGLDEVSFNCKLCLETISESDAFQLSNCGCKFCRQCMREYVKVGISEANITLKCPDNHCLNDKPLSKFEIEFLVPDNMVRYNQLCFEREIAMDISRAFCPISNCASVCHVPEMNLPFDMWDQNSMDSSLPPETPKFWKGLFKKAGSQKITLSHAHTSFLPVVCSQCQHQFCVYCKQNWGSTYHHQRCADHYFQSLHLQPGSLPANQPSGSSHANSMLPSLSRDVTKLAEFDDNIKRCPRCFILIERDNGCAQMRCNRCKHVFCWFCLEPLNDDILLRHYDGPCKVNFGHSRASLVRHRVQVICSLIGICLLIVLNSPLILFICICLVVCKYIRSCFTRRKSTCQNSTPFIIPPASSTAKGIGLESSAPQAVCLQEEEGTSRLACVVIAVDSNPSQTTGNPPEMLSLSNSTNLQSIFTYSDLSGREEFGPPSLTDAVPQSSSSVISKSDKQLLKKTIPARKKRSIFMFRGMQQPQSRSQLALAAV